MSYSAIWRNRNRPMSCSGDEFCCGTMSGSGIPTGMVQYRSFRVITRNGRSYHVQPAEYGIVMTSAQAEQLDRYKGRTVPYFRNSVRFVQSRSARKRGYVSTCPFYARKVAQQKAGAK